MEENKQIDVEERPPLMVMDYARVSWYSTLLTKKETSPLSEEEFNSLTLKKGLFTISKWTGLFSIPVIYRLASLKSDQSIQRVKQLTIA